MYLQLHSVKEPSKNHDIWVRVPVLYWVGFGFLHIFYFRVQFLTKPGFWFGSFLLGLGSVPISNYHLHHLLLH